MEDNLTAEKRNTPLPHVISQFFDELQGVEGRKPKMAD